MADEYRVYDEPGQPPADSPAYATYIPVVCRVCRTRMHAAREQAGGTLVCPDCGAISPVPGEPPEPKRGPQVEIAPGDEYAVTEPGPPPGLREFDTWLFRHREADAADGEPASAARRRPLAARRPPRWFFVAGVFNFPVYPGARAWWLGLWATATIILALLSLVLSLGQPGGGFGAAPLWIGGLLTAAAAFGLGFIWSVIASVGCIAILRETSYGYEEIENWPAGVWLDWVTDYLYVVTSVTLAVAIGAGTDWGLAAAGHPLPWVAPLVALALWPIMLMSMLEANSPVTPWSKPVVASLFRYWRGWLALYAETALLAVATGALLDLIAAGGLAVVVLVAPGVVLAAAMIEFRLLGRLAWYCSGGHLS